MRYKVREWSADECADASTIAPHIMTWEHDVPDADDYDEWKRTRPYNDGDVVLVETHGHGGYVVARARIVHVNREWKDGFPRTWYQVQFETKRGLWAKVMTKTWDGFIQRGYRRAGWEPTCPDHSKPSGTTLNPHQFPFTPAANPAT